MSPQLVSIVARSEQDRPLITLQFQGKKLSICPQCLQH